VSDSDSPEERRAASSRKRGKPLTDLQRWQLLTDAVTEDALAHKKPLSKEERERAQRVHAKIEKVAKEDEARLDSEAAEPKWAKRTVQKKKTPGSGYVM
jgi:hypothetical protein